MNDQRIIAAVKEGRLGELEQLLVEGVDVDTCDENHWSPLCWAAGRGDLAAIELLLERGADPVHKTRHKRAPMMIAKAANHPEAAHALAQAARARGLYEEPRESARYCKAYLLAEMRRFAGWSERPLGEAVSLDADDVVYLHENLTVTRSLWRGENVIFDDVSPQWEEFCRRELELVIPDDLL